MSKAEIVKTISETAVVKATNFNQLIEQVDYSVTLDGCRKVSVGVKDGTKLFVVSKEMEAFLKSSVTTQN